jgi:chromosome segregation ATPase
LTEARDELAQINQHVAALEANVAETNARATEALAAERARANEAARQVEVNGERLATTERELAAVKAATGQVEGLAEALEAESARADEASRRVEEAGRELATAREQLAAEEARADEAARRTAEAEWQLAEARERLVKAETTTSDEPTPAQAVVETDLRHLLETRERELESLRQELAEQRSRYAAVASEVPPTEEPPAETIENATAEPWSRVDEDLLERLARAKSLAGGQD